jgi:hypothetical protein
MMNKYHEYARKKNHLKKSHKHININMCFNVLSMIALKTEKLVEIVMTFP